MQEFKYILAHSVDQVVDLLQTDDGKPRILCGGTDLIVQLREERLDAGLLIDIKSIDEVNRLRYDPVNGLLIGAAVPVSRIIDEPAVIGHYPGLVDAIALIGGVQIQNRASLGGNLCNASPAADSIPALIVHEGICVIASPVRRREVSVEDFCIAPGKTVLERGEMLIELKLPAPKIGHGSSYLRFTPRAEMDIAVVGVGAAIRLAGDGKTVVSARIALGAVAPKPLLVIDAEKALIGRPLTEQTFNKAAMIAQREAQPISDMRGTEGQRRHLVGVLTRRALRIAAGRALAHSHYLP